MAFKSVLALSAALAPGVAAVVLFRRHAAASSALLVLAALSFVLVALVHVFEAFAILPDAGWGHPHSTGHYIDLTAAVIGITAARAGVVVRFVRPASTDR